MAEAQRSQSRLLLLLLQVGLASLMIMMLAPAGASEQAQVPCRVALKAATLALFNRSTPSAARRYSIA